MLYFYWVLGIVGYLVASIWCAILLKDKLSGDGGPVEIGFVGLFWPLFLVVMFLMAPFWIVGKLAFYVEKALNKRR
jgi:hypothetical protein